MSKRGALTDLNHDNWDQEEPDEERGSFKRASEDELKRRVIKKAVRRTGSGSGEGTAIFSNFTGFGSVQAKPAATAFSFLQSATPAPTGFKIDGKPATGATAPTPATTSTFMFGGNAATSSSTSPAANLKASPAVVGAESKKTDLNSSSSAADEKYSSDLKALNLDFAKWVQQCVDKNPVCILTPLFDDYKKYLKELDDDKNKKRLSVGTNSSFTFNSSGTSTAAASTTSTVTTKTNDKPNETSAPTKASFTFGSALSPSKTDAEKPAIATGFTFGNLSKPTPVATGAAADSSKPAASTGFTFGGFTNPNSTTASSNTSSTPSSTFTIPTFTAGQSKPPFAFGTSSTPFTFSNVAPPPKSDSKDDGDGDAADDDEPPKVEFTPVVEEDSVYSKRCKVFVRVDKDYKDRGVGTLFIKNVQDGKKTQVLVRADTSLGNILLNALLTKEIPLKRMGNNNVMLPIMDNDKPTTALIRVKTKDDADELLKNMEENKK